MANINLPEAPIQRIPTGLLGFLSIKSGGQNPSRLSELVQGMLDLMPYYSATQQDSDLGADIINVPAGGGFTASTLMVVPPGKLWYVTHMYALWNAVATPGVNPYVAVVDPSNRYRRAFTVPTNSSTALTPIITNDPFWMDSGWKFGAGHWLAGGTAVSMNLQIARLQITK